jgi:hypothetical protein
MVKYVPDRTGRFSQRPHYEPKELDRECENIIAGFLKERHGAAKYPVSTDDLTVLIEASGETFTALAARRRDERTDGAARPISGNALGGEGARGGQMAAESGDA